MKHISTADALRALEEVVVEKGASYTYERAVIPDVTNEDGSPATACVYVANGAPSCLVGHALHRLGVPLSLLSEHEGDAAIEFSRVLLGDRAAFEALNAAQGAQDDGETWGEALRVAHEEARAG